MLLVTTWFGTFLLDGDAVVHERRFPKEARALADRLDGRAVGRDAELANLRRLAVRAGLVPQ